MSSDSQSVQMAIQSLKSLLEASIIGQADLLERLLIALLADGHLLVEGAPGLAKTRAIKSLAQGIEANFQRIQFTPDLLPADITGSEIYRPENHSFEFQHGPVFHNLVLADEINRAPAKVQSALLEAMAERQVTVGGKTYPLPPLFLVMATQNPIEQEGTYPLPEAQLDRFLMHVRITYPTPAEELQILRLTRREADSSQHAQTGTASLNKLSQKLLMQARQSILGLYMSDDVEHYIVSLISATRDPQKHCPAIKGWLDYGASPRATIALDRCARAHAWLKGKDFVAPEDVQAIAYDVLRHRLIPSYQADAEGITTDRVIQRVIETVPTP
ncbi:MAG: MoxR family ATPase [Hahellaceae bacterium]|jgi:MoxR-like ATPase|nr:MoxR family ATPase [Hahellaceae bacterium]